MKQMSKPYKKLYRSRRERMLAGVCGGLAQHFGIDPTWMRLIFILFFFIGGSAFLAYIILWILVPLEPEDWH
ncbi:PspC domain-containing protein [Legionella nagasakiensis]|uniref:PspC domain-containing protein n=1 Tax=Legionella nagasakiensis TaxID=535290 RepID=UPI001F5F569A|nr:PspC domain-containing protein [Legionella nagasakiensis]